MDRVFDSNGRIVGPSKPTKTLRTVKKMLAIDSGDRDLAKFPTNGDIVIYLPRVYENVVSIRLVAAEFPAGSNVDMTQYLYFLLDIEGLNKCDECAPGAERSGFPDGYFAKIPLSGEGTKAEFYNDHSAQENVCVYRPPIGKLDRLRIITRLHLLNSKINWNSEYSLTFEFEMLDNSFDEFSSFETRLSH